MKITRILRTHNISWHEKERTRSSIKVVFKDVAAIALEVILKNKREYINQKQTESFNNRRTSKKLILIPLVACCEN